MKPMKDLLLEHPFSKTLTPEWLDVMAGCARNVRFSAGDYIQKMGADADTFYLLKKGSVAIELPAPRGPITIQTLKGGDLLGWSWLVPPHRWQFDARAVAATAAIELQGACLREKCETNPSLGYQILHRVVMVIAWRLAAARLQLVDVYGKVDL